MIGKPDTSRYVAGNRGIWQKYKRHVREDFIVIGYSSGEGTRAGVFGALILGREVDGNLVYAGRTGTGFTRATALAVYEQLTKVRAPSPPVGAGEAARARSHASPRVITWTKPVFVATVESADHTRDGTPRFPAFKGMRPR
jgi:bifunctional non-homologous end joining protein LigD